MNAEMDMTARVWHVMCMCIAWSMLALAVRDSACIPHSFPWSNPSMHQECLLPQDEARAGQEEGGGEPWEADALREYEDDDV